MPKATRKRSRRAPLAKELMDGPGLLRAPKHEDGASSGDEDDAKEEHIPADLSRRILAEAHAQQQEVAAEEKRRARSAGAAGGARNEAVARTQARMLRLGGAGSATGGRNDELVELDVAGDFEDIELDAADEAALAAFMPQSLPKRRTLADMIMERIGEQSAQRGNDAEEGERAENAMASRLDPRVVQVYTEVGRFLSHYKSGKMPKAFKIIPSLNNWEEVMLLTRPDSWTPHSVYAATRIFASNLNQKAAQRFYSLVLLPRVQQNIDQYKKLNFHLYQSLRKALYKPAAFFKGIFLPLAGEGCSLREAVIVSSVVAKASVPVLHSSVALLKLCEVEYSGATCLLMKTLLDKKYSLPFRVVDALVRHFCEMAEEERVLPVMWHQNLLVFVQRYKNDLSAAQRKALKALIQAQSHHLITKEIKRELTSADAGGAAAAAGGKAGAAAANPGGLDFSAPAAGAASSMRF